MRRQLVPALLAVVVFTILCGIAYPLAATAIGQVAFGHQADGSLVRRDGVVVGSELLGQRFEDPRYFTPRPSAAGTDGYDGTASGGSNLGPTNPALTATVTERVAAYRAANGLAPGVAVPVDAVTASGSGLDPDISLANALLQAPRVAAARELPVAGVEALVHAHTAGAMLGFLGERRVNVLALNLALDSAG